MSALPEPSPELAAIVVVPARDEEELVGACMRALLSQRGISPRAWEILLVLDSCADATFEVARGAIAGSPMITLHALSVETRGAGGARAAGMDLACRRLESVGPAGGLIATTDADSRVAPDWLIRQLEATRRGAEVIGGRISLDSAGARNLAQSTLERRRNHHLGRLAAACEEGPAEHPFFGGASIGITTMAYRAIGGMEPVEALEDEALARRLRSHGIEIHRLDAVRVTTSARMQGRASAGLAIALAASEGLR